MDQVCGVSYTTELRGCGWGELGVCWQRASYCHCGASCNKRNTRDLVAVFLSEAFLTVKTSFIISLMRFV